MKYLKKIAAKLMRIFLGRGLSVSLRNSFIFAKKYGLFNTAKLRSCLNSKGLPIPWYTYPSLEYLENIDIKGVRVVEYGSGNSSLYYLRRGALVTSLEDDKEWFNRIKIKSNEHHSYIFADLESEYVYREEIFKAEIVVIDGSYRPECTNYLIESIKGKKAEPSMIIFDNSDWYPKSIKKLDCELGWPRADFCGFGPINAYTWVTSIYFNPKKILPRIDKHIASISGIGVLRESP